MCSITDPCILKTQAFRLSEEDFKCVIQESPTYICDICWKFKIQRDITKLKEPNCQTDIS